MDNKFLWHYTSLEALRGIIDKKYLNFWGTRYDSMNDPREYDYAKNKLLTAWKEIISNRNDVQEADKDYLEIFPYVVSLSRKQDDFLMWRLYKGQIALVLNEDMLKCPNWSENILCGDCQYVSDEELVSQLNAFAESEDTEDITRKLQELCSFYKSPNFDIEGEFRLVKCDNTFIRVSSADVEGTRTVTEHEDAQNIHFKYASNNDIILYKEFHICKSALKKIVINNHDNESFKRVKSHVEAWLRANGYGDVKVEQTKSTPVR